LKTNYFLIICEAT